jgi:CubicO group peptidase (beta-lactamase class C family)
LRSQLLNQQQKAAMETNDLWLGGMPSSCAGQAYGWSGGGSGYKTEVWVNGSSTRVAVLLLNARHYDTAQPAGDQDAHTSLEHLYCGA